MHCENVAVAVGCLHSLLAWLVYGLIWDWDSLYGGLAAYHLMILTIECEGVRFALHPKIALLCCVYSLDLLV